MYTLTCQSLGEARSIPGLAVPCRSAQFDVKRSSSTGEVDGGKVGTYSGMVSPEILLVRVTGGMLTASEILVRIWLTIDNNSAVHMEGSCSEVGKGLDSM